MNRMKKYDIIIKNIIYKKKMFFLKLKIIYNFCFYYKNKNEKFYKEINF